MTTSPLTPANLDELLRLEAEATAPPWHWSTSCSFRRLSATGDGDVLCAITQRSDGHPDIHGKQANMDLIVAMRNSIRRLVELAKEGLWAREHKAFIANLNKELQEDL